MRYLRKIEGKTKIDKIQNATYRKNLKTKTMGDLIDGQLRWFGHVRRMREERITRYTKQDQQGRKIEAQQEEHGTTRWGEAVKKRGTETEKYCR